LCFSVQILAVLYPFGKRGVKYFFPISGKISLSRGGGWGMRKAREICLMGLKINFIISAAEYKRGAGRPRPYGSRLGER
jgi:hypothetical protein